MGRASGSVSAHLGSPPTVDADVFEWWLAAIPVRPLLGQDLKHGFRGIPSKPNDGYWDCRRELGMAETGWNAERRSRGSLLALPSSGMNMCMSTIDQYSDATVPITMFFQTTQLASGTAFIWISGEQHFLVTNWHNVSGKDPRTGKHLSKSLAEPDRLAGLWNSASILGVKFPHEIRIRDDEDRPMWWVHPKYGNRVDVVALPIPPVSGAIMHPINTMHHVKDMRVAIGHDIFVLGYPFGVGHAGLPIWKRGSIASEPEIINRSDPYILIDTASRPGMSGSPVILRKWGGYQSDNGATHMGTGDATRLIGVYSGRLSTADPNDAQLGLTWPTFLLEEIIAGKTLDT